MQSMGKYSLKYPNKWEPVVVGELYGYCLKFFFFLISYISLENNLELVKNHGHGNILGYRAWDGHSS